MRTLQKNLYRTIFDRIKIIISYLNCLSNYKHKQVTRTNYFMSSGYNMHIKVYMINYIF